MGDKDTAAAEPGVVESDGWRIEDGGLERESAESVQAALSLPPDAGDEPPAAAVVAKSEPDADVTVDGEPPAIETPKADAPKPKRTVAGRVEELKAQIGTLTKDKHAILGETERARRERDDLARDIEAKRKEIAALGAGGPRPAAEAKPETQTPPKGARPKWADFDKDGDGDWDKFLEAQDAYLEAKIAETTGAVKADLQKELRALRENGEREAYEARQEAEHRGRMSAARAAHKDDWADAVQGLEDVESQFLELLIERHQAGGELFYQLGMNPDATKILASYDWTNELFDAIAASDNPSAVLLHLASEAGEFERVRQMPPARVAYAIGVLDGKLSSHPGPARANGSRPGPRVSQAAAPIRPVGSSSAAPAATDGGDDDDEDITDFFVRETKRDIAKHGRAGA